MNYEVEKLHKKRRLRIFGKCVPVSLIMAAVLLSGTPVLAANQPAEIKDIVNSSDYAMQSIRNMAQKGIISGDENGDFHPHAEMTRAEAAKILVLSLGLDTQVVPETPTFQDVSKDNWAYGYVEAAYKAGIVSGVAPDLFDPDGNCTREQLAKMFVNSMELSPGAFNIEDAVNSGLVNFKDYDRISDWAKDAVRVAVYAGIMQGTGDSFLPDENATKEQMAVVADRFTGKRTEVQQELDAISNTQVTGKINGFVFVFSEPMQNFAIRSITDQNGVRKMGSLSVSFDGNNHKWLSIEGEHTKANCSYSYNPKIASDKLVPGETYKVRFSFNYKYGDTKTVYCEKDVTILPNSPHVESVIPLSVNQIRVEFSDWVKGADAGMPENYMILDENGNEIPIDVVAKSSFMGETEVVILNFSKPAAERSKFTVYVKEGIQRFSDSKPVLPYSYTVVLNDQEAPDIEQVTWGNDGTYFTSATIYFSEPVLSGTVMIDNVPAGTASGEVTTISGLRLDGSQSHQIEVRNISDGVNTGSSVLSGTGRLYDPPKTETVPPVAERVDFTRDESGRVNSLIITYDEDLLPMIPSGGQITAFDENGNPVYGEQPITDPDGNTTAYSKLFCYPPVSDVSGKTAVFPIADGVDIYSGRYTIVLPAYLVADTQYNDSLQQTITVDF